MRIGTKPLGLSIVLLAMATGSAPAQDDKDQAKGPLRRMRGEWTFRTPEGEEGTWAFKDEKVTVTLNDRKYVANLTADRRANPHTLDFAITEGPDDAAGKTVLGIYKFDGASKLTIAVGAPDQPRPTEFKSEPDTHFLFELTKKE